MHATNLEHLMDSIFFLNEGDRATFLQLTMHSFACTYICLRSYLPQPPECLIFMDGLYQEENKQPTSSSGSLARRLFDEYRQSVFMVHNGVSRVPGLAFKNSLPYIEVNKIDLPRLVSTQLQWQFYQEARIRNVIFMGCKAGEIELGMSNDTQINLEREMRNWFLQDFSQQALLPHHTLPSSSSSSLSSLSMVNPESSPILFNLPNTPYIPQPPIEAPIPQALRPISTLTSDPFQQAIQALGQIRNIQIPSIESEDAALIKAFLVVLTSSTSSSSHHPQKGGAFENYRPNLLPMTHITTGALKQYILEQSINFFSKLNLTQTQEQVQRTQPIITQLHHVISERRRRQKLNQSFQELRSLLPPGSKRDKVSVLNTTSEYLTSLKAQVEELSRRNRILEAQLPRKEKAIDDEEVSGRLDVRFINMVESTSKARIMDLQVSVRGEYSMLDVVMRVVEFLKRVKNVSLLNVQAQTRTVETTSIMRVLLRMKIEGGEWDEFAFQEAVRRGVDDLAQ